MRKVSNVAFKISDIATVIVKIAISRRNRVYLFGVPLHPNLGDQAQRQCIRSWIEQNFSGRTIIELYERTSRSFFLWMIKKFKKSNDIFIFHSGYFFVDHHPELLAYIRVIKKFHDQKILIFPQTINIKNEELRRKVFQEIDCHGRVLLLCRDAVSYSIAKQNLSRCRILLFPDIVSTLITGKQFDCYRKGIIVCMRNDAEALYPREEMYEMIEELRCFESVKVIDTSIDKNYWDIRRKFQYYYQNTIDEISRCKVVITDRYHGTIFSLIAGTPVIVISSTDHKLESGVKWFPSGFGDYVNYARDLQECKEIAHKRITTIPIGLLSQYFKITYYDKLKEVYDTFDNENI